MSVARDLQKDIVLFSLVLCTKNRGEQLRNCLEAIEALEYKSELQLLLVDNGSTDGISFELLNAFATETRFDCQVLQTFARGNSAGRNVALPHVTGRFVLFIDDDCYVDRHFVDDWEVALALHDVGYASGMITPFDPAASGLGCNTTPNEKLIAPGSFVERGFVQGSNMMFSAACLADVGHFDPRFGAGTPFAGEEWDVALRASYAGWRGAYFPGPRVAHDHRRFEPEASERQIFYDIGGGAVYAKNTFARGARKTFRNFLREVKRQQNHARRNALVKGFVMFLVGGIGRAA